jgi:hypothetical protein
MDLGTEMSHQLELGPAEGRVLLVQVQANHFTPSRGNISRSRGVPSFGRIGRVAPYQALRAGAGATVRGKKENASDASETGVGQAPYRGSSV